METTKRLSEGKHPIYHAGSIKEIRTYRKGKIHGGYKYYDTYEIVKYTPTIIKNGTEITPSKAHPERKHFLVQLGFNENGKHYAQEITYPGIGDINLVTEQPEQSPLDNATMEVIKPTFKPEAVQLVFDILKDFFNSEQHPELERILKTGGNVTIPLLFKDNGNRLGYAFRLLKENDFIIGVSKKDLGKWTIRNFQYVHRNKVKPFTPDYVEKCISRNQWACQNPLFEIKDGIICNV